MRVKNKVRDYEIVELPVGGTLSLDHASPVTFSAGHFLVIHGSKIAIMPPEDVAEEFDVPSPKRTRTARRFGLGKVKTNSDATADGLA